ncbi:ABC transporter substrate-binding protein [Vibrio sp. E150_011]
MNHISSAYSIKKQQRVRRTILVVVSAALALAAIIATSENKPEFDLSDSSKKNTLAISGPWEFTSIDPSLHGYIYTRMQVLETLLNINDKGAIIAGLASNWQSSDDNLIWRFTLRSGVKFHDGQEMDAEAVVNSLKFAQRKHGVLNTAEITNISAVSNNEVQITLAKPYTAFTSLLTHYSTAILSPDSYKINGAIGTLYGSGPYQVAEFAPPHKLTVKKFNDYWGHKPTIKYATYLTGHRVESRILQAKSGEADIVFTLGASMLGQQESDEAVLHSTIMPRTLMVKLNSSHPCLDSIAARKALSLAIDRSSIASNVLDANNSETVQIMPSALSQWHIEEADRDEYSLNKANELLAGLGWTRNASGLLERNGMPFTLTMMTYADRPELTAVATAIQAQWAKLGVKLKIDVTNSSMIPAGHNDDSLEVALIARNFGTTGDPLSIMNNDFTHGGGDWGAMNWHNSEVDQAMEALILSPDPKTSYELSQKVATIIYQEAPVFAITSYTENTGVNKRVKNFRFDPFERDYFINQMELK